MVIHGRDAQRSQGGEIDAGVEGADFQQGLGQEPEVIHGFQQPHQKFQQYSGYQGQSEGHVVHSGVQRGVFDLGDFLIHLPVHIVGRVSGAQVELDLRFRSLGGHFLFDGHGKLDVLPPGVDPLTGNKPVDPRVFGHCPAVASQEQVKHTEIGQAFPALIADIALGSGDLEMLLKEVGGAVPVDHDVGNDHIGRRKAPQPPPVYPVSPGGVILSRGGDTNGEDQQCAARKQQSIGQQLQHRVPIPLKNGLTVKVVDTGQRQQHNGEQKPHPVDPLAGDHIHIEKGEEEQADPQQPDKGPGAQALLDPDGGEEGQQPHGDSGFIKLLPALTQGNEDVQCRGGHGQHHPPPHIAGDGIHGKEQDPADGGGGEQQRHEQDKAVFWLYIKVDIVFHSALLTYPWQRLLRRCVGAPCRSSRPAGRHHSDGKRR